MITNKLLKQTQCFIHNKLLKIMNSYKFLNISNLGKKTIILVKKTNLDLNIS